MRSTIWKLNIERIVKDKNVKPWNESLNCWTLIVGKKELKPSFPNSNLDLFKARGVRKVEKTK